MAAFGTDVRFNNQDTAALSVVIDQPQDWERAKEKMPDIAKASILFDRGAQVSRRFGFLSLNSSMHAGILPGHTYLLIDKQGIVRDVYDDANMGVNNDKLINMMKTY